MINGVAYSRSLDRAQTPLGLLLPLLLLLLLLLPLPRTT